MTKVQNTDAI